MAKDLNIYDLSRKWFDFCFSNPEKIELNQVLAYKYRPSRNYSRGGFYLIKTEYGVYIGKSIDYLNRIKQHLYNSSSSIIIDRVLKFSKDVELFLLLSYTDAKINFFNRNMETIIEQTFIDIAIKNHNKILNQRIYGHIQIK